jgi:hypothetical protein
VSCIFPSMNWHRLVITAWATLIHRSMDGSGVLTLGDLAAKVRSNCAVGSYRPRLAS